MSTVAQASSLLAAGDRLTVYDWPLPKDVPARATVLLVHGLGEHAGRYERLALRLNSWGYAVRAYDQYGHGRSAGPRGGISTPTRLLEDLTDLIDNSRARMKPGQPLVLLGHSLGGLLAARLVSLGRQRVEGLVLSSPALDPGLNPLQKLLLASVARLLPDLRVGNGLDLRYLSHDPAVAQAYRGDGLCHPKISGRLARFIAEAGPATVACAPRWSVPTLLMYAGADRLVSPAGSQAFAAQAPACVESVCFEPLYHELFNETEAMAEPVFERLRQWLQARF